MVNMKYNVQEYCTTTTATTTTATTLQPITKTINTLMR